MVVLWGLLGCPQPEGAAHPITGTVLAVEGRVVTLDHEPIVGLMPAMVMELPAPEAEVATLQRGDRVSGELLLGGGETRLRGLVVVGRDERPPAFVPERDWSRSLLVGEVLEPLDLPTSAGPVRVGRGQERVTVLTFLFTSCPVPEYCPLLATKLASLQGRIGGARIVSVTLDPAHDTLAVLDDYGRGVGADPATWVFGRLEPDALAALIGHVDLEARPEAGTITHNLRLLVLDAEGRLVHREKDNSWEVDAIAKVVGEASAPGR